MDKKKEKPKKQKRHPKMRIALPFDKAVELLIAPKPKKRAVG